MRTGGSCNKGTPVSFGILDIRSVTPIIAGMRMRLDFRGRGEAVGRGISVVAGCLSSSNGALVESSPGKG